MVTRVKKLKDFRAEDKALIVGLPGMGRVGYVAANYVLSKLGGELVAEIYSTSFPPHLIVRKGGISELFLGKLFETDEALIFTADTQPQNPEGQNEICDALLNFLSKEGDGLRSVIATAAYVVPSISEPRKTFVVGNNSEFLEELKALGTVTLDDGVIMGINGAVIGWARYYSVKGAVLLGETWATIVEFDETDYRAAKAVVEVLRKYLGVEIDSDELEVLAQKTESRIKEALTRLTKVQMPEQKSRKEVL
ncbi:MAG: PAC2 family protein [Desulfurococcales archaeon]|nr:PAC2 family protein [Desulfurococcales archaeon]